MQRTKILNGISLNMLAQCAKGFVVTDRITTIESDAGYNASGLDLVHWSLADSYIGHADLCHVIKERHGVSIPCNRATASLTQGEKVVVVQYKGPRLPEGATRLPDGSALEFLLCEIL